MPYPPSRKHPTTFSSPFPPRVEPPGSSWGNRATLHVDAGLHFPKPKPWPVLRRPNPCQLCTGPSLCAEEAGPALVREAGLSPSAGHLGKCKQHPLPLQGRLSSLWAAPLNALHSADSKGQRPISQDFWNLITGELGTTCHETNVGTGFTTRTKSHSKLSTGKFKI